MITRNVGFSLLVAFGLIGARLAATWAANAELAGPDFPERPWRRPDRTGPGRVSNPVAKHVSCTHAGADKAAAKRFMGLVMVLGGLVYAGAFLFAPVELAPWIGMGAVITALLVTTLRFLLARKGAQSGTDGN